MKSERWLGNIEPCAQRRVPLRCPGFCCSLWCLACFFLPSESRKGEETYEPQHFRKLFCNSFTEKDVGEGYALTDLADDSGSSHVDFSKQCMQCNASIMCPSSSLYVRATPAQWKEPLCCEVKSLCMCPEGMTQTSCTANGLESLVPIYDLFVDNVVVWEMRGNSTQPATFTNFLPLPRNAPLCTWLTARYRKYQKQRHY